MTWNRATALTFLAAVGCIVGGAFLVTISTEAGVALVTLGGGLGGWLVRQPRFAQGKEQ